MFPVRLLFVFVLVLTALVALAGCQEGSSTTAETGSRSLAKNFRWQPLYGDGTKDISEVVARVGDFEITSRDIGLFFEELSPTQQNKYSGPDGKRLLLKRMVDTVLLVQGSVEKELYNDPDVARTLIAQRRVILKSAMINYGLLRDNKPSEAQVREFFMNNRDKYRQAGIVEARHIECLTKEKADEAYKRLLKGGQGHDWMSVLVDYTVNRESKKLDGSVGWFNQGGIIPFITGSQQFTTEAYQLEKGLHAPFLISNRWHVVEILMRENERPMTFTEAKGSVELEMLPAWQDGILKDYLLKTRREGSVELLGEFAPGKGLSADELFARALAVADPAKKIELLNLIHSDYPQSDRADDALFLSANTALESLSDVRVAERYLLLLLDEYPDSELASDATFLKDNLHNPEVLNPKSIEDLRK
jgi:peptidyl-prolyl cis-trans isomerase C